MTLLIITSVVTVVVALVGLIGAVLKIAYDALTEEKSQIKDDVTTLKRQVAGLLLQGRHKDDYINTLRSHIEQGKPPPPPPYPAALLRITNEGL